MFTHRFSHYQYIFTEHIQFTTTRHTMINACYFSQVYYFYQYCFSNVITSFITIINNYGFKRIESVCFFFLFLDWKYLIFFDRPSYRIRILKSNFNSPRSFLESAAASFTFIIAKSIKIYIKKTRNTCSFVCTRITTCFNLIHHRQVFTMSKNKQQLQLITLKGTYFDTCCIYLKINDF